MAHFKESEKKTCMCVGKESVKNYSSLQNNHFWRGRSNLKFLLVVLPRKKSFKVEHEFKISMLLNRCQKFNLIVSQTQQTWFSVEEINFDAQ